MQRPPIVVTPMHLPGRFMRLFEACAAAGGRALVVGGAVRDHCRGGAPKDLDVEVHGLEPKRLEAVLKGLGRVGEVGKSFGVYKLRLGGDEVDVSVPRRDRLRSPGAGEDGQPSKLTGHKGIEAEAAPFIGTAEAARRRDLTINAIAWDPLLQRYEDPWGGLEDLQRGLLRAVDPATFVEDPLRALRVAQFAGRFGFTVDPTLRAICAAMPLDDLPAERVWGEVEKLLTRSTRPSVGWDFAVETGMWARLLPEWHCAPAAGVVPTGVVLDRLAGVAVDGEQRRVALLLAGACLGLDVPRTERVLGRLNVHRLDGYRVREQVLALVAEANRPPTRTGPGGDAMDESAARERVVRAAERCDVELLARLVDSEPLLEAAATWGVTRGPLPLLLGGKDLVPLGVAPGPRMGEILGALREEQLAGRVTSREEAAAWVTSNR